MLTEKKNTLHAYPSLLPLRMALILAESESPAHPPRIQCDVNEQLALQLIEKVKAEYKRSHPFLNWRDIPSQHGYREGVHEMVIAHA
jgi:hypothetical protein